jgi:hypothetical protein
MVVEEDWLFGFEEGAGSEGMLLKFYVVFLSPSLNGIFDATLGLTPFLFLSLK